jgi:hypothetical protein
MCSALALHVLITPSAPMTTILVGCGREPVCLRVDMAHVHPL